MIAWLGQKEPKLNMDKFTTTDQVKGKYCSVLSILSQRVAMSNTHALDCVDEETWPPNQPKNYIPLVLIHHQEQRTKQQDSELAKLTQTGDIGLIPGSQLASKYHRKQVSNVTLKYILNTSTVTKQVAEILALLEKSGGERFVLIEGAPGTGKSVLLKHIACQWGKKLLLTTFKIMLLVSLHDFKIWQATSIRELLCLFCEGATKAKDISKACSDYLLKKWWKRYHFSF